MAYVDRRFKKIAQQILSEGYDTTGEKVRPKWGDGTPAHTKSIFGVTTKYDLSKEFPILNLRRVPFKSAADELLWIWVKKSNAVQDLNSGIWDAWATTPDVYFELNENGSTLQEVIASNEDLSEDDVRDSYLLDGRLLISKFELAKYLDSTNREKGLFTAIEQREDTLRTHVLNGIIEDYKDNSLIQELTREEALQKRVKYIKHDTIGKAYGFQLAQKTLYPEGLFDQVEKVIYDLRNNKNSRSIITSMYVHDDLSAMGLRPCAYSMTFNVKGNKLNAILNQRSQDFLTANAWNVTQYALLVHMIAHVTDLEVGELLHVISDCHIYDRHEDTIKTLLEMPEKESTAKVWLNPKVKEFEDFTIEDIKLEGYEPNPGKYHIEVAE